MIFTDPLPSNIVSVTVLTEDVIIQRLTQVLGARAVANMKAGYNVSLSFAQARELITGPFVVTRKQDETSN